MVRNLCVVASTLAVVAGAVPCDADATPGPKPVLHVLGAPDRVTEVRAVQGGRETTLETFASPQRLVDSAVSPDGRWAFVWHVSRPPQTLSLYDLRASHRVASFHPGYGGDLRWTPADTLLHVWGCGTSCQVFRIYDPRGAILLEGMSEEHFESPSLRFMITGPSMPLGVVDMVLYDLRTARVVLSKKAGDRQALTDVRWDEPRRSADLEVTTWTTDTESKVSTMAIDLPE